MDPDDTPDAALPDAAERLLERWRSLDEPGEAELRRFDQVMNILRSSSVRDSHETLVDTALLAAPLPPALGDGLLAAPAPAAQSDVLLAQPLLSSRDIDGRLPEADGGISISLQALALEQLLGRQRIASAVSGLTVALFLALVLWMASSNQVGAGPLVRGPQAAPGAALQRSGDTAPRDRARTLPNALPGAADRPER
ncbi:MAG: hypothetical protein ABW217_01170 [Polyangiaceae bacterium]